VNSATICCGGYEHSVGSFATSHDGGNNWNKIGIADNGVFCLCLFDDLCGYALVGSYGGNMVWGTSDGGSSWKRLTQPRLIRQGGATSEGLTSPFQEFN
jgi:photosystem II stability/assembly factor-like uncharacterized protein